MLTRNYSNCYAHLFTSRCSCPSMPYGLTNRLTLPTLRFGGSRHTTSYSCHSPGLWTSQAPLKPSPYHTSRQCGTRAQDQLQGSVKGGKGFKGKDGLQLDKMQAGV